LTYLIFIKDLDDTDNFRAKEAAMLNVALFNKRAKQWREENPDLKGNMRELCKSE